MTTSPVADLARTGVCLCIIQLVDDEYVVLRTARTALERYGYSILVADSGPAAIDVFRREKDRISLVVLDLSMPGMTGQQTLPHLRAIKPGVHVLVSSGYNEVEALRAFGRRTSEWVHSKAVHGDPTG
jgi:two-component system cell cycle sensor histidine kinase/response regulator CckA